MSTNEPKGSIVPSSPPLPPSPNITLTGQHTILVPLNLTHTPALFAATCGPQNDNLWTYMPGGPFPSLADFTAHIDLLLSHPPFFTIFAHDTSSPTGEPVPVGLVGFVNIMPANRCLEIGHVLFGPLLQRTRAATEVFYLLLKYAFDDLHYMRVEWKANDFNEPSKRAVRRLGFMYEGTFRKHMVVKGRRRDTAWFSCLDEEWFLEGKGGVKRGLEGWLDRGNFDGEGRQVKKLEEIREAVA